MKPVGEQFRDRALEKRSPVFRWLFVHRAEIAQELATQARPAWQALAQAAADAGVLDINGQPPSRHAVRSAWKAIKRAEGKALRHPAPSVAATPAQQVPHPQPAPPIAPRHVFRVATFRNDKDN